MSAVIKVMEQKGTNGLAFMFSETEGCLFPGYEPKEFTREELNADKYLIREFDEHELQNYVDVSAVFQHVIGE